MSREYASLLLPCVVIYKKFLEMTGAEMIWIPGSASADGIGGRVRGGQETLKIPSQF